MLIPTFNEKHYPQLFDAAKAKGSEIGAYVREKGWVEADLIIARTATGYVNNLPLNNLRLEKELCSAFITAAAIAATKEEAI
jgi:hypothetical protein